MQKNPGKSRKIDNPWGKCKKTTVNCSEAVSAVTRWDAGGRLGAQEQPMAITVVEQPNFVCVCVRLTPLSNRFIVQKSPPNRAQARPSGKDRLRWALLWRHKENGRQLGDCFQGEAGRLQKAWQDVQVQI